MSEINTLSRVTDYVLKYFKENNVYPNGKEVAAEIDICRSTADKYIRQLRDKGIIKKPSRETGGKRERPGEDLVYNYITEFERAIGTYPSMEIICVSLKRDKNTVKRHIAEMIHNGRLENKGDFYPMPKTQYKESLRSKSDNQKVNTAIWPDEIRRAKKKIKVGDTVLIKDDRYIEPGTALSGRIVQAQVISKHRHVVCLSHRLSCTYAQLAKWYLDESEAIE